MKFDDVVARLRVVRWGSATHWDPRAAGWLRAYYQRLLPYWPAERKMLSPTDPAIEASAFTHITEADRGRIAMEAETLWTTARDRAERVEAATKKLVAWTLAWACAVDAGALDIARDPGAPLIELFGAGFQIAYTNAGIELHYSTGWNIAPVPARASLA